MSFTVSRDDFKLYFTCPRKLALKTMGVKVREVKRPSRLVPAYAVGLSGEKLTEEILEIIASLQADKSKEYVEVLSERGEPVKKGMETLVKALRTTATALGATPLMLTDVVKKGVKIPEVEGAVRTVVGSTVEEVFRCNKMAVFSHELEEYESRIREELEKRFLTTLGECLGKIPKITAVYEPTLRNRDTCSLGRPDFQVETVKGHILIEVKNWENLDRALREGREDLLYYNSLLADLELGDSIWLRGKLPSPARSLIVIPRWGVVKEVLEPIPKFREVAAEIWRIKRAALVDGALPDTKPVSSVCKRCAYKKFCKEGESLEPAKPIPLIYRIAEYESGKAVEEVYGKSPKLPEGFWKAYTELMRRADSGDREAEVKLRLMKQYLLEHHMKVEKFIQEEKVKELYRAMPNEFDSWGGVGFLKEHHGQISVTAHMLFSMHEKDVETVLKVARRRWNI